MKRYVYIIIAVAVSVITCKQVYSPPETNINNNWLVVEGTINTGNDSTIFKLSRTVKLTAATSLKPELNATLTIESNANNTYPLTQKGNGVYFAPPLNLDPNKQYRLRIRTTDNKQYLSDFVETKATPPIDALTWKADDASLKIYNSTHDPNNKARYYKWDFSETYEFHSFFSSRFVSNGVDIVSRDPVAQNIGTCWKTVESTSIGLASTVKLSQDVVNDNLLTTIPSSLEKVSYKYSILLKQYALTKDAFEFWERLKKNTEQVGSIFDAQPSALQSNIHNLTTPAEPVIGYVSACNIATKRIFISIVDLPRVYSLPRYQCKLDTFRFYNAVTLTYEVKDFLIPKIYIPTDEYFSPQGTLLGYFGAGGNCIDCTLRGSNKKPVFWQ
jgi:hypothetical protein